MNTAMRHLAHPILPSLLIAMLLLTQPSWGAQAPPAADNMDLQQVIQLLREQQRESIELRRLVESQSGQINSLKGELAELRGRGEMATQVRESALESEPVTAEKLEQDRALADARTDEQKAVETGAAVAQSQQDDPTRALLSDFKGAWQLPGTSAALAIGGYVKTSVVYNNDPLASNDRFIVGSIPVGSSDLEDSEAQSRITVSQSRLNFDLREVTQVGILRAFIEGDFAEDNDTFRLRHAFGQWRQVLAGKTWSAFVDNDASPEEVDFEGLNGRVNLRQSQVRLMPTYGADYAFQISLEDPNPEIQNGQGVTRTPDLIASARFQPNDRLHLKTALLARQIRGQRNVGLGSGVEKKFGWGVSLSGRYTTPFLDVRDSVLFQLNAGTGIGRYVNDLSSVGNFDGIFNPETGDLELFDVLAGYVSWQHWWRGDLRSNFTFGAVSVDNPGFVDEDSAYRRTYRFSSNLLWAPSPRIDLGLEYLWGRRENENGANGDASQIQLGAKYKF